MRPGGVPPNAAPGRFPHSRSYAPTAQGNIPFPGVGIKEDTPSSAPMAADEGVSWSGYAPQTSLTSSSAMRWILGSTYAFTARSTMVRWLLRRFTAALKSA